MSENLPSVSVIAALPLPTIAAPLMGASVSDRTTTPESVRVMD